VFQIRKAFEFEDLGDLSNCSFFYIKGKHGFGIQLGDNWIAARPDVFSREIVVTRCISGCVEEVGMRVGRSSSLKKTTVTTSGKTLRSTVVAFLTKAQVDSESIDW
jgi:hypothetical protein